MALSILLAVGILTAIFVGFNIGGSSTGVAFGPAVGSGVIRKFAAGGFMAFFALLGGWTVGRNVIATMGGKIVPSSEFTLLASVGILFFVGLGLLISNIFGVPASTSMTAVGAIAGLGVATGTIDWAVMGVIVSWWIVAPVIAFWVCAVIGRYLYPHLAARVALDEDGPTPVTLKRFGPLPYPAPHPEAAPRDVVAAVLVVVIGCYMAFSAGASNVANAVAPLVGSNAISMNIGILLAAAAIGAGAFTIARRTLDTVGSGLTHLPLLAALIVEVISATIITFLSLLGIPASLAVSATMCIVGLGWGRATRAMSLSDAMKGEKATVSVDAVTAEQEVDAEGHVPKAGTEDPERLMEGPQLFDPGTTGRVIRLWLLTPSIAAILSFGLFSIMQAVA